MKCCATGLIAIKLL